MQTKVAYFVFEHISTCNLEELVWMHGGLDEWICKFYFRELLKGLRVCHSKGIVHRDIHPSNVMIDSNFDLRLGEFSLSCENTLSKNSTSTGIPGRPGYWSPEMFRGQYSPLDTDLFACAVLLFFMRTGN